MFKQRNLLYHLDFMLSVVILSSLNQLKENCGENPQLNFGLSIREQIVVYLFVQKSSSDNLSPGVFSKNSHVGEGTLFSILLPLTYGWGWWSDSADDKSYNYMLFRYKVIQIMHYAFLIWPFCYNCTIKGYWRRFGFHYFLVMIRYVKTLEILRVIT